MISPTTSEIGAPAEAARLRAENERLRTAYDALVLIVMRGSHREARDLARPRFVKMHPEEKGHAAKLARDHQQSVPSVEKT